MKKFLPYIIATIIILVAIALIARFITPEDTWLCVAGQWVKHGNPSSTKPTSGCVAQQNINQSPVTDFTSCATAGNPVMESYPRQCQANGQNFTEILVPVGESCLQSADCLLPMNYAARSDCPYQAYCYKQKCVVGCPSWQEKTNTWDVKCQADKDCNCSTWNEQINYTCACVDGQCTSILLSPGSPEPALQPADYSVDCLKNKGTWLAQYHECEYISQTWCTKSGGVFNDCASACRHDPQAQVCTMQCVPVCQL